MLQLKNVKKNYVTASETVEALKGIDLSFRQNEFVSILGPSGCGKTTLLNLIGGLDHYTSGDLTIAGKSTKEYTDRDWDVYRNHRVGFIFQSYNLIPHQTVLGNVELALTIAGISKEERVERAKRALDRVGLAGQYYKRPNQLSGGQCQRVAIARALVNDPEILLADEPTGALDTVTSKQIMELIREISGERLVIMVTHNPEIAEEYSTRIIRLLDGRVIEDTNPFSAEEEKEECAALAALALERESREAEKATADGGKRNRKRKTKEKARMSFFTAFKLSARNLLSKKGRTTMVGIAGSIGIIGIALVLAFSAGIKGFVASMQDDMLSGNPIEISETGFNVSAVTDIMNAHADEVIEKVLDDERVYINSTVTELAEMADSLNKIFSENVITPAYVEYVKNMDAETYNAILYKYGITMATNVFTDFKNTADGESEHVSIKRLIDMYTAVLGETEYKKYSALIPILVPTLQQAPSNRDYILSQYDLLGEGSRVATEKNEIMLVLNPEEEISDLLLAAFGYYTQEEFLAIINRATAEDGESYEGEAVYREYFKYDELLGKEFVWYPNDTVFTNDPTNPALGAGLNMIKTLLKMNGVDYNPEYAYVSQLENGEGGVPLKVVGILTPKDNVSFGSLTSGIYYTEALTEHILESGKESKYIEYLMSDKAADDFGSVSIPLKLLDPTNTSDDSTTLYYTTLYNFTYRSTELDEEGNEKTAQSVSYISPSISLTSFMGSSMTGEDQITDKDYRDALVRNLGGNDLANHILIYPKSFDEKFLVTEYLDRWNEDEGNIQVDGVDYPLRDRTHVTYTDTLELVIEMINTMIDVVKYALVAFTSISLVVSTVMIGIITYVSVVERIKEIGVIRALGGRKKDVRHLFNAETFIIGLLAGLIGIAVTYLISIIVNLILTPLIGYSGIAALPITDALLLIALSVGLTCISGLIPASSAAKKDPVVALRTE